MPSLRRLHYQESGPADAPAIVFLHGFMGSTEDWTTIVPAFSEDYRCIAIDLPGHGASGEPPGGDYGMERTAAAVSDLVDEIGAASCFLVGYSMGGRLALYLAVHYPSKFSALVLESSNPGIESDGARAERRSRDHELAAELESVEFADWLRQWYAQPVFASLRDRPELSASIRRRRERNDPRRLAASLRGMGAGEQPSLWDALARLPMPVLLLAGELDGKYLAVAERMADLCPVVERRTIARAGHTVHLENPRDYAAAIREFLTTER